MSMTVPDTPIGGRRLPGVPDVNAGPRLSAADFGANSARDLERLSKAVQATSDAFADKIAQATAHQQLANAKTDISQYRDRLFAEYKGVKAGDIGRDLDKYTRERMEEARKQIGTNQRAYAIFDGNMTDYAAQNSVMANRRMIASAEEYRRDSLMAELEGVRTEAAAFSGDPNVVMRQFDEVRRINAELHAGRPPESIELENRNSDLAIIEAVAAKQGMDNPRAALDFINTPKIREKLGDVKFEALRGKYEQSAALDRQIALGRGLSAMKGEDGAPLSFQAMYDKALEEFPDDPEKAHGAARLAANFRADAQRADNARLTAEKQGWWDEYAQSGYATIPQAARLDHEIYGQMLDFQSKLRNFQAEKPIANEGKLIEIHDMSPDEYNEFMSKGENVRDYIFWLAGDASWKQAIDNKMKGAGGGGGDKPHGGMYGDMDIPKLLEGDFIRLKGYDGWASDTEYDGSNMAHQRTRTNFLHEYRKRWKDKEAYFPGEAPDKRAESIYYGMIRENRDGRLDLNKAPYDIHMEADLNARAGEAPVAPEELPDACRPFNRGERIVARPDPRSGRMEYFGVLDPGDEDVTRNGVPADIARAALKVERVYQRTELSPEVAADAGDNVVTRKSGLVEVWARGWTRRIGTAEPVGPPLAAGRPEAVSASAMAPEPVMSGRMRADLKKFKQRYGEDRVSAEWTGKRWNIAIPGQIVTYTGAGTYEGGQPAEIM